MSSANDKIADGIQAHSIDLERFSVDLQNRVLPILNRVERQLVAEIAEIDPTAGRTDDSRKARKEALLKQTRGTIATGYNAIKKTVGDDLQDIAKLSDTAGRKIVNDAIGVEIMTVAIAPEQLRALADGTMIQGAVVKEHWDRQETALRQKFVDKVQDGFIRGESSTEIVNRVRGTKARNYDDGIMKTTKAAASALVHTSVQSVANSARLEVFKAQSDILKGIEWLSTLDNRTSVICRSRSRLMWTLDGEPIGHSIPLIGPPAHFNAIPAGSMIQTLTGLRAIEEIEIGDFVLTHRGRFRPVYAVMSKQCDTGVVRVIETDTDRVLRATDEHPVLTFESGWKRADDIKVGDQLFEDCEQVAGSKAFPVVVGAADNYPPPFEQEQVFDFVRISPSIMASSVHLQQNSGVGKGKITDIGSDDELVLPSGSVSPSQCIDHELFRFGDVVSPSFGDAFTDSRQSGRVAAGVVGFHTLTAPSVVRMGVLGVAERPVVSASFDIGGVFAVQAGGCGLASCGDAVTLTPAVQHAGTDPEFSFDGADGLPLAEVHGFNNRADSGSIPQVYRTQWGIPRVVSIIVEHYTSTVFNLAVKDDETYVSDGIVVHNCRSTLIPVLRPWSEVSDEITEAVKEKPPKRLPKKEVAEEVESPQESGTGPVDPAETTEVVKEKPPKPTKPRPKKEVDEELEGIQASMTGPVSKDLDYEAWLKTQPLAMQLEVLGPAKHKLWQDGKLTFRDLVDQRGNPLTLAEIIAKVESGQTTTARGETMRRAKEAADSVREKEAKAAAAEKDVRTQVNRSVKAGHVTEDEREALKEYRETRIDGQEPPAEAVEAFDARPEWMQDRINAAIAAKREALRAKEQAGPAAEYAKRKAVAESAQRIKSTLHEPESVAEWVPGQITDATLHGVPFAPWRPSDGYNWMTARGRTKIPGEAALPIIFGATAGAIAAMLEDDGRVWMYQPVTAEGATNALPFGTLESGMDAQAIALREAWEATGLQAEIVSILGDYRKPNSVMRYYIARRIGGAPWLMGHEAQSVKLVPVDQLAAITDDETDKAAALDLAAAYRKAIIAGNGSLIAGLRAIMEAADDFQTAAAKRRTAMLREWVTQTAKSRQPSAAAAAVYASLTADEQAAYAALAKERQS